jgi:hypothetical protein
MADKDKRRAVEALLSEYRNVVVALQKVIANVSYANLTTVVDSTTTDANCQSIQTILTHVVSSGYSYAGYIRKLKKIPDNRPGKVLKMSAIEYHNDLDDLISYTSETFAAIKDDELEEFDEKRKIKTSWGQVYDIEQMMEHAVVHVLRHRRQIEKFRKRLEVL